MLKGQAALLRQVLGEAHSLLAPCRDPANLEAAVPAEFLRGVDTEGARGRWSKLCKALLKAAKDRKARTFSEAMPSSVAAPGLGAFAFGSTAPEESSPKILRVAGEDGLSRRERARLKAQPGPTPTGTPTKPASATPDKSAEQRQLDYSTATPKFTDRGAVFEIGPSTTGVTTKYDAAAAREAWGKDKCLPFLFSRGLLNCPECCQKPGDPDHQEGGSAHTLPEGAKGRKAFNLKRSDARPEGKGGGKGGGRGGSKGGGKGGGRGGAGRGGKGGGKGAQPGEPAPQ